MLRRRSAKASSLAGHQRLGNLVLLYVDNHISIDGDTATAFSEDALKRYEAYGWHVQRIEPREDGDVDVPALYAALTAARAETARPSIIAMRTIIVSMPSVEWFEEQPRAYRDRVPTATACFRRP